METDTKFIGLSEDALDYLNDNALKVIVTTIKEFPKDKKTGIVVMEKSISTELYSNEYDTHNCKSDGISLYEYYIDIGNGKRLVLREIIRPLVIQGEKIFVKELYNTETEKILFKWDDNVTEL